MAENFSIEFEDALNEIKNEKTKLRKVVDGDHVARQMKLIKRLILALTKPSCVLGLGTRNVRAENREKLRRLLGKLVRNRNWKEASGVLSVFLKGTIKDSSPVDNRMKYLVTMELLKHIDQDHVNSKKIKHVYEIWMRKIGSMKNFSLEDRFAVQMEFILFSLSQGNLEEANQAAICLMQEREFGNDRISNLVVGLTYYQLWYSNILKEMQLSDLDCFKAPGLSEVSGTRLNSPVEYSVEHYSVNNQDPDITLHYDSESSVMNNKVISVDTNCIPDRDISAQVDVKQERENFGQSSQAQGFYVNSTENSRDEAASCENYGANFDASIFDSQGLDSWLLPLKLPDPTESDEISKYMRTAIHNDYYKDAVRYLQMALSANPPVLAALVPLVQLLLLGYQVNEALHVLEKCCSTSVTALPFRLRGSLLEHFDRHNFPLLSSCYENILKKDPTCNQSLARLINMHHNGDYSTESLVEMIGLHLDATYAEDNTWKELAFCFLKLTKYEEDQLSVCLNGNEGGHRPMYSVRYNRIPKIFTEAKSAKSWWFRCKWWLRRYFSNGILETELAAGNLPLLAHKAACASHMYGREMDYVVHTSTYLENENRELFLSLQMHMQHSIGFYLNFIHTSNS